MRRPFEIPVCASCLHAVFPPRPLCPACGGRKWRSETADSGVVEERTRRFHRTREERRMPVHHWRDLHRVPIAFVRLDRGPAVVAWSPDDAPPGARVNVELASGVPVARLR